MPQYYNLNLQNFPKVSGFNYHEKNPSFQRFRKYFNSLQEAMIPYAETTNYASAQTVWTPSVNAETGQVWNTSGEFILNGYASQRYPEQFMNLGYNYTTNLGASDLVFGQLKVADYTSVSSNGKYLLNYNISGAEDTALYFELKSMNQYTRPYYPTFAKFTDPVYTLGDRTSVTLGDITTYDELVQRFPSPEYCYISNCIPYIKRGTDTRASCSASLSLICNFNTATYYDLNDSTVKTIDGDGVVGISLFNNLISIYNEYSTWMPFFIRDFLNVEGVECFVPAANNPAGSRIKANNFLMIFKKDTLVQILNEIGIPFTFSLDEAVNTPASEFSSGYIEGYEPPDPPGQGENTTSDWTGAGDNTEDSITLDSPSFTPFGDVMNQYALNALQLRQVNHYLFTADIFNDWDLLKNDPREGLVSCRYYPFELRLHDSEHISADFEEIVMGGVQMDNISGLRILSGYNQVLDLGEFDIQEYFGGFLDYQLTTIDIYLPYIGWQQLNASHVMGRKLRIKYIVDLITGECACLLFSTDGSIDRLENVFQGVMGIDIPILTSNYNENVKQAGSSILSAGVAVGGAIATFATGGAAAPIAIGAGAATIANSAATIATMQNHQKLGTPVGSSMSLWMPQDIIFRITRPRKSEATEFKNRHGYRANFSTPLSEVSGYCQVDSPRLDIIATDREKEELKTLLQGGIYL